MEARDGSGPCPSLEFGPSAVRGVVLGDGHRIVLAWRWFIRVQIGSMGVGRRAWAVGGVSHGKILRESSEI